MGRTQHIGIVAVTAEGAALCYRTICHEGPALLGEHGHPDITLDALPLSAYMDALGAGRWDEVGRLLLASARRCARAGAAFAICPDNTAHQGLDLVRDASPLPWLHIAEEVADLAVERGHRRLGVLGTRWLMEGPVYPRSLEARGLAWETPSPEERRRLDHLIFSELVQGRFEAAARAVFQDVIRGLAARGCDAVVLGCTEIPLLIGPEDSPLPVLDSTRTLARAALRRAVA